MACGESDAEAAWIIAGCGGIPRETLRVCRVGEDCGDAIYVKEIEGVDVYVLVVGGRPVSSAASATGRRDAIVSAASCLLRRRGVYGGLLRDAVAIAGRSGVADNAREALLVLAAYQRLREAAGRVFSKPRIYRVLGVSSIRYRCGFYEAWIRLGDGAGVPVPRITVHGSRHPCAWCVGIRGGLEGVLDTVEEKGLVARRVSGGAEVCGDDVMRILSLLERLLSGNR